MYIRNWDGKTIHSFSDSSFSRGVSILFSKKCRKLHVYAKIEDVYAPNKESDILRFLNSLKKFISTFSEQGCKIMVTLIVTLMNKTIIHLKKLCKVFKELHLIDVWHYKNLTTLALHGVMHKIVQRAE